MCFTQCFQQSLAFAREANVHLPSIVATGLSFYPTPCHHPIDEPYGAMMLNTESLG
ncbi:MAG: hypothetical protein AMXMBFR84_33410 [Candidatus Hydrogenedentota bacterium]